MKLLIKYSHLTGILCFLPLLFVSCKTRKLMLPAPAQTTVYKAPANFRVVGYLLGGQIARGQAADFDLSRINYLNIFFNGQGADHKLKHFPRLDSTITAAHQLKVTVLASIGNATNLSLLSDTCRKAFIDSLVRSVADLHLDGIDVDLEDSSINKNYEVFVNELSVALKLKGKLITAAIATWESPKFTDRALACFDFLNVMTYDATGPWRLNEPGPHSPYSMAVSDLDFWTNKRGIPKNKLNLGLPFYGYGFGPGIKHEYPYNEIIALFPGSENTDKITVSPGNDIFYNGLPTIKSKTSFAMQNAGGVMIWELLQDGNGSRSLLTAIDQTANPENK